MGKWLDRWREFRNFDRRGLLFERVEGPLAITPRGYVVDRRIFRTYFFLIVLPLIVFFLFSNWDIGWRQGYAACPLDSPGPCENPCYGMGSRCGELQFVQYIQRGESLGVKPSETYARDLRIVWAVAIFGLFLSLVLNHFYRNRGRPLAYLFPKLEVE